MTLSARTPPRRLWASALVALLCANAALSSAHEGVNWQHTHIGRVTHASLAGQRQYVATAQGVVACLTLRTGEVAWRQVLEENDPIDDAAFSSSKVIALSSGGKLLRAWGTTDGALLWEEATYSSASGAATTDAAEHAAKPVLLLGKIGERETVTTLSRGRVQVRSAADGSLIWDTDASSHASGALLSTLAASPDGRALYAAGVHASAAALTAVSLHYGSGRVLSAGTAASAHHLVAPCVVLASTASRAEDAHSLLLVAAGVSGARLAYANLADLAEGKIEAAQYAEVATGGEALLPEIAHASAAGALQLRALGSGLAALDLASGLTVAVLHASPRNTHVSALSPTVLSRWVTGAAVSPPVQLNLGAPTLHIAAALHLADDIGGGTTVEVVDVGAARIVHTERFLQHNASAHGMPTAAFLGGYSRRDGGNGFRVAVTSEDASYALLQQGQVVWAREEALADVVDTLLLEPPDTFSGDSTAAMSYVPAMLGAAAVRRLALDGIGSVLRSLSSKQSQNKTANSFAAGGGRGRGVDPVFVVLTACGKVLGLSTELGAVVWSWWPPADAPRPRTLLLWRGSHAPQLLLAGSTLDGAATRLVWLDAHTGAVAGSTTLPLRAARLVPLSVLDAEGRRIVLLWEPASGEVAVFPNTLQAAAAALSTASKLFLHAIDGHGGVVNGYTVTAPPGAGLRAVPAWSVVLHSPVIASAVRPPGDVVFSRTRVRGDRSTAYKFLSPNTLLLVTCAPPDAHHAVAGLEVFILDTVTGRFLYRVRHAAASGPVTATAADNWFVYAYWSEAAQRTEVSVLELFEDGVTRSSGSLSAAIAGALAPRTAGGSHGDTSSSLVPPTLRVLGQTYSLGVQLAALGVTVTRRGLASRHLLLGTRSGRVVALDRRFVDPRRPTRPTAADREEGLVPYSEALPLLPGAYLTGAARAARIRGVHAAPATLESACHVLAYGLDVVYARTAPSQTFDTLGSGFSRALLAITLTLLSAGAAAAGWAVRRDNLSRRWQ